MNHGVLKGSVCKIDLTDLPTAECGQQLFCEICRILVGWLVDDLGIILGNLVTLLSQSVTALAANGVYPGLLRSQRLISCDELDNVVIVATGKTAVGSDRNDRFSSVAPARRYLWSMVPDFFSMEEIVSYIKSK